MSFFKYRFCLIVLFGVMSILTGGCEATLPSVELKVGSTVFHVELATTIAQREKGLMNRDHLAEKSGMLFVFAHEVPRVFWMKNTHIPLSIAFANSAGVIKTILDMSPYSLEPRSSGYSAKYALEVNQGAFKRLGIHVGDKIDINSLPPLHPEALPSSMR